jgi:hypothetical protein
VRIFSGSGGWLARLPAGGVFLSVLVGISLRFRGLPTQLVFGDEIHALNEASNYGYGYIFTHFGANFPSIPFTLYAKFVAENVGLEECLFRLPSFLCGCATLILLTHMVRRRFTPVTAWMAAGLLAISPYHVYLSREARPYAIVMFLVLAAVHEVSRWSSSGEVGSIALAALFSFGAIYFHLIAVPVVAALFLYVWGTALAKGSREYKRSAWLGTGILVALCAAFLSPALPSFPSGVLDLAGEDKPDLGTVKYGVYLVLDLWPASWIFEVPLAGLGFTSLVRNSRQEALLLAGMLCFQAAFVFLAQPQYVDIPWVWLRYHAVLLPIWVMFLAAGVCELGKRLPWRHGLIVSVAIILLLVGLYNGKDGLYPLGRNRDFNVHPMVMSHELGSEGALRSLPSSAFYWQLREQRDRAAVLELPFVMVFPVYDLYQRIHRRRVFIGALGSGFWQELFNNEEDFNFRRMVKVRDGKVLGALPAAYIIVHKDIGGEIRNMYQALLAREETRNLLKGYDWMFTPQITWWHFRDSTALMEWGASRFGSPIYEDKTIIVYRK